MAESAKAQVSKEPVVSQKPKEPRPFRPTVFLFRMLAAIFFTEAGFLAFAFVKCSQPTPGTTLMERCPKLGERSETLFIAAISTTLGLIGAKDLPAE